MSGGGGSSTISTSEPRLGALRVQQSTYGLAVPIVYGRTRVSGNLVWYGDFVAIAETTTTSTGGGGGGGGKGGGGGATQSNTTYTYEAALIMALCEGPISSVNTVWVSKQIYSANPLNELGLSLASGAAGQSAWGHLATNHPSEAIGYSGIAYVCGANYSLTTNAEIANHSFEVDAQLQYGGGIYDANPKEIIYDFLTNAQYGANFPASRLSDMTAYSNYCRAMGLFISPALTEQQEARAHLSDLAQLTNSSFIWSEGKLKIVPYGDEEISGNGATYAPNLTPIYDLTDDDFIVGGSEDPVMCDRKTPADAFNQIQVEYLNRANAYNVEISEVKDQANIEKYGLRPQDPIKMHAICEASTAKKVAQLVLQRTLYVRNEYEFKLGWKFALLEPMDLVTLTDEGLGLSKTPVRVISIEEDEDGLLTVRAEDYPFGVSSATLYPSQTSAGYAANYNASAGDVAAPVFFEPPVSLTTTGLEVWCAVSGQSDIWGGCKVWASMDGNTYKQVGTVYGGARYGALSADLDVTAPISLAGLGGQIFSGTAQDATLLNTLCWAEGEDGGEFFAYETATLTGANAYTLGGLVRGAYGSTAGSHASGSKFVRVDQSITKSEPLDVSLVGTQIYFKFTSFNVYGSGTQALADVSAYSYTITGRMLSLPPSQPTGLSVALETNGVRIKWDACAEPDYASTLVKTGATWLAAVQVSNKASSTHLLDFQTAGDLTVWIAHIDKWGNESVPSSSSIVIRLPSKVQMVAVEMQANALTMQWLDAKTDQPILRYEYFIGAEGASLANCVSWGSAGSDGRSDLRTFRTPGAKQVYVVAYDIALNASEPTTFVVNSSMPPDFVLATEYYEDWQASEMVNTTIIGGAAGQLLMPVVDQTWGDHFSSRGWANAQAQIDAGYPLWWQPAASSGYHIERHDCGRVIAGGVVNVTVFSALWGSGAISKVSIRASQDAIAWSAWVDSSAYQASTFRYVEVRYAVTSNGYGAMLVDDIHVDVRVSSITETAVLALSSSDVAGTFYATTKSFLDIQTVQATALNSINITRINTIIKDDVAPFGVYVQAWDTNLNRVSGSVSLSITGV